jgi:hypothetical protein
MAPPAHQRQAHKARRRDCHEPPALVNTSLAPTVATRAHRVKFSSIVEAILRDLSC